MEHDEVVVVGAGLSGLAASAQLRAAGRAVRLIDKADRPGGRLSGRTGPTTAVAMGPVRARITDPEVAALVSQWTETTDSEADLGDPAAVVAAALADQPVDRGLVTALERHSDAGVTVVLDGGARRRTAAAVVLTAPVPQSVALLERSGLTVPGPVAPVTFWRRWVLAAELGEVVVLDETAGAGVETIARLRSGDGRSGPTRAVAAVANRAWSQAHADADATEVQAALLEEVHHRLPGARVVWSSVKRWRYADVATAVVGVSHVQVPGLAVWLAGDGFDPAGVVAAEVIPAGSSEGPAADERGVERAVRSGLDAAAAVLGWRPPPG